MWTPSSANALAGGTAPGVLPGTTPPEEQSQHQPAGPNTETVFVPEPAVVIGLSEEVRGQLDRWFGPEPEKDDGILPEEVREAAKDPFREPETAKENRAVLSEEERQTVQKMAARDAQVRAHENAHVAAAGGMASAPSYTYETGPDGKRYAIGGSVKIDMSPEATPEETLKKAERIRAAAMAPAEPSPQDAAVASRASQMASDARAEIAKEQTIEAQEVIDDSKSQTGDGPWSGDANSTGGVPDAGSTLNVIA